MITYKKGNLLDSNCNFIVHQVNCQGAMGSGIAKQIRYKWPRVYSDYKETIGFLYLNGIAKDSSELLGYINWTKIDYFDKYIVNFFSQDKYLPRNKCHTNYDAFGTCCIGLKNFIESAHFKGSKEKCTIGFPYKIGCGLAGGDWNIVSKIIEEEFQDYNVEIWEYENSN